MEKRGGRVVFGVVLFGVSVILFLSAAKVALPSRQAPSEPDILTPRVDPAIKERLFTPPAAAPSHAKEHAKGLTKDDLNQIYQDELIAVAGPAGSSSEELIKTVLADTSLPRHIREPFVALAKAKAPQLLEQAGNSRQ